jgi:hypothetical protein
MPGKRAVRPQDVRGLSFAAVAKLATTLPDVNESTSYGTPALKLKDKLLARVWEDGATLVLRCTPEVRAHLLRNTPTVFFLTDHYRDYPWVLVRLAAVRAADLEPLLEDAWRQVAGKRLVAAFDARKQ